MKKLLLIALAGVLVSCTQRELSVPVSFSCKYVESGSMVKGVTGVAKILSEHQPTDIKLQIQSKRTNKLYNSDLTTPILLPVGAYNVTGYNKAIHEKMIAGTSSYFSKTPKIDIRQEVEIVSGVTSYQLLAIYSSIGIAIDLTEVERATFLNSSSNEEEVPFIIDGDTGFIFAYGDFREPLRITIYPKDKENNEPKTFKLCYELKQGTIFAERGKYYILHPNAVETGNADFGIDFPAWGEVDTNDIK